MTTPMNRNERRALIIRKLDTSNYAVEEAVLRIYALQTADEQSRQTTVEDNGVGFNGYDAAIMSSFAEQIRQNRYGNPNGRRLSMRQMEIARRKIKKYVGQLVMLAERKAGVPREVLTESALPKAPAVIDNQEEYELTRRLAESVSTAARR